MGTIYRIRNKIDGKCYIGQCYGDNIYTYKQRIVKHLKGYSKSCIYLHHAVKKYGADNFEYEFLHENVIPELLDEFEIHEIKKHDCVVPNGYNIKYGGSGGGRHSATTKQKISQSMQGITIWKGKSHTQESKLKISESHKSKAWESSSDIIKTYLNGLSLRDTAQMYSTSVGVVRRILVAYNTPIRSTGEHNRGKDICGIRKHTGLMIKLYDKMFNVSEIAEIFGVSSGTISNILRDEKVEFRKGPRSNYQKKIIKDHMKRFRKCGISGLMRELEIADGVS